MLNTNQIDRLFQGRRFEQLLRAVSANGRMIPAAMMVRLSQSPTAATGLALSRIAELTYGPTPTSRAMTEYLLETQLADGSWENDPLATAIATAALASIQKAHSRSWVHPEAGVAAQRGLAALACMQHDDGLFTAAVDRAIEDRALAASFVLHLLAQNDEFRMAVRFADLMNWFEQHSERMDQGTKQLWHMARADSTHGTHGGPALTGAARRQAAA